MRKHLALGISIVALGAIPVLAQNGGSGTDTLSALLVEVRALRVAMERAASTTPQIQLLAARLTVQNERLSRASRDADAAHQALEGLQAESGSVSSRVTEMEELIAHESDPVRQRQFKAEQQQLKNALENSAGQEGRLRARESELANAAAVEQAQWTELNRRLDELERELAARRPQ